MPTSSAANLAGSVALVSIIVAAGVAPPLATTVGVAVKKSTLPFLQVSRLPRHHLAELVLVCCGLPHRLQRRRPSP